MRAEAWRDDNPSNPKPASAKDTNFPRAFMTFLLGIPMSAEREAKLIVPGGPVTGYLGMTQLERLFAVSSLSRTAIALRLQSRYRPSHNG
jgi:hypothetical protein